MPSVPLPKAARAAAVVAFLIAVLSALSLPSGLIMLLGVSFSAVLSAVGILQRRAWSAYGFALLLFLALIAVLFFAVTGKNSGTPIQIIITAILYSTVACLFLLAGHALSAKGNRRGSPLPWVVIAILFSAPFILLQPATVRSNAMQDTLLPGDFVLINGFSAAPSAAGKLVAFHFPLDRQQILIRRVAGLPGDRIRFVGGTLVRNGQPVSEPYVTHKEPAVGGTTAEVLVPAHKYFVLGDARTDSLDSRQWGLVDANDLIGEPKFIYDSLAPDPTDMKPADPKTGEKILIEPGHPPQRRWNRVFKTL